MKLLLITLLLFTHIGFSQNTGTGGSTADEYCRSAQKQVDKLLELYNKHKAPNNPKIKDLNEFLDLIRKVIIEVNFKLLKPKSNSELVNSCGGEKNYNEILAKYPWLKNPEIAKQLNEVRKTMLRTKCEKFKTTSKELNEYIEFLLLWLEKEVELDQEKVLDPYFDHKQQG